MAAGAVVGGIIVLGLIFLLALLPKKVGAAQGSVSTVVTRPPKYPYADLINRFAEKYGEDPDLIAAVIEVESNFDPDVENVEDPGLDYDSSYGLMQVQLAVAQDFGKVKDYRNATISERAWLRMPENNVNCGTWNLDRWVDKYGLDVALHMENVGEHGYNVHGRRNWPHVNKIKAAYDEYKNAS